MTFYTLKQYRRISELWACCCYGNKTTIFEIISEIMFSFSAISKNFWLKLNEIGQSYSTLEYTCLNLKMLAWHPLKDRLQGQNESVKIVYFNSFWRHLEVRPPNNKQGNTENIRCRVLALIQHLIIWACAKLLLPPGQLLRFVHMKCYLGKVDYPVLYNG